MWGTCHENQSDPYLDISGTAPRATEVRCRRFAEILQAAVMLLGGVQRSRLGCIKLNFQSHFYKAPVAGTSRGWGCHSHGLPAGTQRTNWHGTSMCPPCSSKRIPPVLSPNRAPFSLIWKLNALFGMKGSQGRQKAAVLEGISARTGFQQR